MQGLHVYCCYIPIQLDPDSIESRSKANPIGSAGGVHRDCRLERRLGRKKLGILRFGVRMSDERKAGSTWKVECRTVSGTTPSSSLICPVYNGIYIYI